MFSYKTKHSQHHHLYFQPLKLTY